MAHQLRPLARLFRAMAELIDQDHASQSRDEAIAKAAGVVAARATAQELVAGRRWPADGAELLATAYAFHAGLPRQAATAAHVQVMQPPGPVPSAGQRQAAASPASSGSPRLDAGRLPGSRLGDLDPGAMAKLWTLLSDLRGGQAIPRGELIRLTGWLPPTWWRGCLRYWRRARAGGGAGGLGPQRDRSQRPCHARPGGSGAGLAGGRRAGLGSRQQRP